MANTYGKSGTTRTGSQSGGGVARSVHKCAKDPLKGHGKAREFLFGFTGRHAGLDSSVRRPRGTSANVTGHVRG